MLEERDRKRGARTNEKEARFARLAFDISLKALRHNFAIAKDAQMKASLSLGGGGGDTTSWGPCGIFGGFLFEAVTSAEGA